MLFRSVRVMDDLPRAISLDLLTWAQTAAWTAIAGVTGLLFGLSLLALFGFAPWLELQLGYGGVDLPHAGAVAQLGLTLLFLALCFFLPANRRMLKLERSHRDFHVSMEDVARAYRASHLNDRRGLFTTRAEFDSMRERITHLRNHPQLGALEPGVIELAAQMSHEARALADAFSDRKVRRARATLERRERDVRKLAAAMDRASTLSVEVRARLDADRKSVV